MWLIGVEAQIEGVVWVEMLLFVLTNRGYIAC
jgi:hypothetical protein